MTSCVQPLPQANSWPMANSHHHPVDVLQFAAAQTGPHALVVVADVTGGTLRAQGALMCVAETGEIAGYISNGCVDGDVIFQARQSLKDGKILHLRYGDGSPFKDITLPCGGRVDLICVPNPPKDGIADVVAALTDRREVEFTLDDQVFRYSPVLRLRIAGRGEAVRSLAKQALRTGFEVIVQSPDREICQGIEGCAFEHLTDPERAPVSVDDAWTAVVLMFHDHDWEPAILAQALSGPAFYTGAMGSPRTHDIRTQNLKMRGLLQGDIGRIYGPIGLIPSMRDANLLALSTLAEIVKTAQEKGRL